jgi:hypothetical protein
MMVRMSWIGVGGVVVVVDEKKSGGVASFMSSMWQGRHMIDQRRFS